MANDINRVTLVGRLTRDPELRATNSGANLARFTLANNRTIYQKDGENKEEVGFFDCVVWGRLAEIVAKYALKGRRVGVDGSLRFSAWDNAEGKRQSKVEIFVEKFQFLDVKQDSSSENKSVDESFSGENVKNNFDEPFNDDIPF